MKKVFFILILIVFYTVIYAGLSTTYDWMGESNQDSTYYGWRVSTAGDVNGDGYSDVIVGAKYYDNGETNEGAAFVYYGSSISSLEDFDNILLTNSELSLGTQTMRAHDVMKILNKMEGVKIYDISGRRINEIKRSGQYCIITSKGQEKKINIIE